MPKVKILARQWKLFIEADTADTFQKIGGIESFTLSSDSETTDNTDFDTDGYSESFVSGRSNEISVEGSYVVDPETKDRDLGQALVETLATKIGHESLKRFRLVSPANEITEYNVHATLGDKGGGTTDKTSWGATMGVSGKPVTIDPAGVGETATVYKDKDGTTITIGA